MSCPRVRHPSELSGNYIEPPSWKVKNVDWWRYVNSVINSPTSRVVHVTHCPPGMPITDPRIQNGYVVAERRYELPAGHIPATMLQPARAFDSHVPKFSTNLMPARSIVGVVDEAEEAKALTEPGHALDYPVLVDLPPPYYDMFYGGSHGDKEYYWNLVQNHQRQATMFLVDAVRNHTS